MRQLLSAVLLLACAGVAFGQGNSDNVRNLNNRVLQLHAAAQKATPAQIGAIRSQAAPVLAERAAALEALIRRNPSEAIGLAFSQDILTDLAARFPGSANALEKQGAWEGVSDHLIFDDPARQVRRYQVSVKTGNEILEIYSAHAEPECVSGNTLRSTGVRVNNVVAAGNTTVTSTSTAAAACSTLGAQNSAVILVEFPGIPLPAGVTNASVSNIFFANTGKSVNTFWREASYNQASAAGQVFGPYLLPSVYTCDQYSTMRTAAIAAADAAVNFTQFTRIFIVFPDPGGCGWAGLGTLGCSSLTSADGSFQASTSWLLATYMGSVDNGVKLATHEGGHNLTLHHSSSRDFGAEAVGALGDPGVLNEYGDTFSTMGSWNLGHYPAQHKVQMGWLPSSNVITVETPGNYFLLPFENTVAGAQALKVRRGTGGTSWLWLEYRQPVGLFDSTLSTQVYGGALVHQQDSTTGTHTHLVDFTTDTASFSDPALTGAWTDPYTNLSMAVTGATSSSLSVNVGFSALTCTSRVQPTVVLSPANPSVMAGSSYTFTVSVTNNDPLGCGSSTFSLGSALPTGWATVFSAPSLTISPGQSLSATMGKAAPVAFTPGTYAVDVTVSDANHNVNVAGNITVIASTCSNVAPTVTLSALSASAVRGGSANFNLSVRNNEVSPCSPRTFNLSSLLPTGWTTSLSAASLTVSAGATGSATITKSVPLTAAFGPNTVSGTAADALHSVTANATLNVVEPITTSLTGPLSVPVRTNETLSATVRFSSGAVASGATVTFTVTRSNGGTSTGTATTNASGVATWNFRSNQRGTFTATASATVNGATAVSAPFTFTVN